MKCDESLRRQGTVQLMLIVVTLMMGPSAWAAGKYKTLHTFQPSDGSQPSADLIFDAEGNLYGTAAGGGPNASGTVFKLAPNPDGSWTQSVLYGFCSLSNCVDGATPQGDLIFDGAGNLYGTTANGGVSNFGAVFKLMPNPAGSWKESVLYSFTGTGGRDGGEPIAGVIFDTSGNLYGTTLRFGAGGKGVVFELTPNTDGSWTESVLHSFTGGTDGEGPWAGVIFDQAGNLYGTTVLGGAQGDGAVFRLAPNPDGSWKESVLYSFRGKEGGYLYTPVIFDGAGNLYGAAFNFGPHGGGVVFKLTPNPDGSWKESALHSFCSLKNCRDGYSSVSRLIFDQAGNLFGTTELGGHMSTMGCEAGCGVVFKLAPNSRGGWTETVLHTFLDRPGADPNAGLIFDTSGNLYGTTAGDNQGKTFGSVFEIKP